MEKEKVASQITIGCFDQLPDDVVLLILTILSDFKILSQLLLVSKNFASMICRIQKLTIRFCHANQLNNDIFQTLVDIICSKREGIPDIIEGSSSENLKFYKRLEKFRDVKSINVEFDSFPINFSSPPAWGILCRSPKSLEKMEILASISPGSMRKKNNHDHLSEINDEKEEIVGLACLSEWIAILIVLIKCRHRLENVTMGYSHTSEGVFVLRDEQLVEWRNKLFLEDNQLPIADYMIHISRVCVTNTHRCPLITDDAITLNSWDYMFDIITREN